MFHHRRLECGEVVVAAITLRRRRNVSRRLTKRCLAVAGIAGTRCCSIVAVFDRRPRCCAAMTAIALLGRTDVSCRLGLGILRNIGSTVAIRTLPSLAGVIHCRRRPSRETAGMAGIALSAGRDMHPRLR